MPLFKYRVTARNGKVSEILVEGESREDSINRVRQRGFIPIECLGQPGAASPSPFTMFRGKGAFDPVEFSDRLAPLLEAHIPLEKALGIIHDGLDPGPAADLVEELRRGLHEGRKLSELVRERGSDFPPIYANLLQAGEESGALPEVVSELQRFLSERRELKNFLVTSAIYPVFVVLIVAAVLVLLLTVFIPKFGGLFEDMGRKMPLPTAVMVWTGDVFLRLWWLWLLLAAFAGYTAYRIKQGGTWKERWDRFLLRVPVVGKLVEAVEIARFLKTLSILVKRQVHLLTTVNIAAKIVQNSTIKKSFTNLNTELGSGARLSTALAGSEHIPRTAVQMLAIGEESGEMGTMLERTAKEQEKAIQTKIKRLLALFEPVVIMFLAVIVFFVVLAVILAIMDLSKL